MDDDRLRDIEGRAGSAARPPDFRAIAARGRARRRVATFAAVGISLLVIAGAGVGARSLADDRSGPSAPDHSTATVPRPTGTPPTSQSSRARNVVADPHSRLWSFAVSSDDPRVRAAVWQRCSTLECRAPELAVAVTRDAFAHAAFVSVRQDTNVTWVGGDKFLIWSWRGLVGLFDPSGRVQPLRISNATSPLEHGETLVGAGKSTDFYAVRADGTAHRVPLPAGAPFLGALDQNGRTLWGLARSGTVIVSSPDGGATWRSPVRLPKHGLYGEIPSADPTLLALTNLGDDAVDVPSTLRRSVDGGATWTVLHPSPLQGATANWMAVTPDGRLLVNVPTFAGGRLATGLYESDDSTWTAFRREADASPHPSKYFSGYEAFPVVGHDGTMTLWTFGDEGGFFSTDDGRTWSRTRSR